MADELANKATPTIPPRLDLKKMGIMTPPASAPQAAPNSAAAPVLPKSGITFNPVTPTVSANIASAAKKETSRIPLNMAKPAPSSALAGGMGTSENTIRVKPVAPAPASTISSPTTIGAAAPETVAKRTTSRISLDAVLGAESASEGLKTIKLKRPGDTIKVAAPAAAPAPTMAPPPPPSIPEPEIEAPTETAEPAGRKTIKLKRDTMAKPAGPAFNISRSQGLNANPVMGDSEEKVFFVFPICSLLAIVATILVIVMFMSQLYTGVSWPGKIMF